MQRVWIRVAQASVLAAVAAACGDAGPIAAAASSHPPLGWIDVRLGLGDEPSLGLDGPWTARAADGTELARGDALEPGTPVRADAEGRLLLGDTVLGPAPIQLETTEGGLICGGARYRGSLRVELDSRGPRLVNRVAIDDYLRGVLPGEMPDRFGLEALKAQAVAARSYALSEAGQRGWIFDDARSQVYRGQDGETWLGDRAVAETQGQVLTHDGKVFSGWFHSTCGGVTAAAASVFDDPPPGVLERPVACPDCRGSPTWEWSRRIDGERVCEALQLPGPLEAIEPSPALFPGRPETITVRAGGMSRTLRAVDFRSRVSSGLAWSESLLSNCWSRPARVEDGQLVVHGRGWGHGVGLCQYGAAGFARRGATYRIILRRYYPQADLVRLM